MSLYKSERHLALDATFPACNGPCDQGRRLCVTPQACQRPDRLDSDGRSMLRWLYIGLAGIATALLAVHVYFQWADM